MTSFQFFSYYPFILKSEKIEGTLNEIVFEEYSGRNLFTRYRYYGVYDYCDKYGNTKRTKSISYNLSESAVPETVTIYYNNELNEAKANPTTLWTIYHCSLSVLSIGSIILYLKLNR